MYLTRRILTVGLDGNGIASSSLDSLNDLESLGLASSVVDDDFLPGLAKLEGNGGSDTARGSRY